MINHRKKKEEEEEKKCSIMNARMWHGHDNVFTATEHYLYIHIHTRTTFFPDESLDLIA